MSIKREDTIELNTLLFNIKSVYFVSCDYNIGKMHFKLLCKKRVIEVFVESRSEKSITLSTFYNDDFPKTKYYTLNGLKQSLKNGDFEKLVEREIEMDIQKHNPRLHKRDYDYKKTAASNEVA